jgi:transposase-like protein
MDEREDGLVVDVEEAKSIKSYTAAFKLQVIREAKETSRRATAKRFGVDPKRVREWLANENKLLHTPKDKRKIGRCGRHPLNDAIDE